MTWTVLYIVIGKKKACVDSEEEEKEEKRREREEGKPCLLRCKYGNV
jgi:hypothetical protein